jgi:hypothetical protein
MDTIRTIHLMRRAVGLAAVPALALGFAACGDDDDDSAGSDGDSFCEGAQALEETTQDIEEPTEEQMTEAFERLTDLEPPEAIADEWDLIIGSLDPENLEAGPSGDPTELQEAADVVDQYMSEECGLD